MNRRVLLVLASLAMTFGCTTLILDPESIEFDESAIGADSGTDASTGTEAHPDSGGPLDPGPDAGARDASEPDDAGGTPGDGGADDAGSLIDAGCEGSGCECEAGDCDAGIDPDDAGSDPTDAGGDPDDAGWDANDAGGDPNDAGGDPGDAGVTAANCSRAPGIQDALCSPGDLAYICSAGRPAGCGCIQDGTGSDLCCCPNTSTDSACVRNAGSEDARCSPPQAVYHCGSDTRRECTGCNELGPTGHHSCCCDFNTISLPDAGASIIECQPDPMPPSDDCAGIGDGTTVAFDCTGATFDASCVECFQSGVATGGWICCCYWAP